MKTLDDRDRSKANTCFYLYWINFHKQTKP